MPVYQQTKKIFANYPLENSYGQYNYGKIEEEDVSTNLGFQASGFPEDTHLYTTIETGSLFPENSELSLSDMKKGMSNGLGSYWKLAHQHTKYVTNQGTEGYWRDAAHSIMYIDGAVTSSDDGGCNRGYNAYKWLNYWRTNTNFDQGHITKTEIECKRQNGEYYGDYIPDQSNDNNMIEYLNYGGFSGNSAFWVPVPSYTNGGYWNSTGDGHYYGTMIRCYYEGRSDHGTAYECVDNSNQGKGMIAPSKDTIYNFHLKNKNTHKGRGSSRTTVNDIVTFNKALRKNYQSQQRGWIFNAIRIGNDERERRGRTRTDERDRGCGLSGLDKSCLAEIFYKTQQHDDYNGARTFQWTFSPSRSGKHQKFLGSCIEANAFHDNFGDNKGYKRGHENDKQVVNMPAGAKWEIKPPSFNVMHKLSSYANGGANASYVDKQQSGWWCVDSRYDREGVGGVNKRPRVGLNPRYTFDAIGLPDNFKNGFDGNGRLQGNRFLKIEKIELPFRAISTIKSSTFYDLDLQNYYGGISPEDKLNRIFTSAPTKASLSFNLAKSLVNQNPSYINFSNTSDGDEYKDFDYWFFVANWDWKSGDPKTIKEIRESFPQSTAEMEALNNDNLYKLYSIGQKEELEANNEFESCDQYFDSFKYNICSADYTYVTPGQKVIKAVIFRTIGVDEDIPTDENGWDMSTFIQAIDWQVATIKLNLSEEALSLEADFGDLGGDEFTYLPYPGIFVNNLRNDNDEIIEAPSGQPYNSAHVVVGGLHQESNYVKSIKTIKNADIFDISEGTEKQLLQKSYELTPLGDLNELGQFPGKLDLGQIRFFTEPYDMKQFLNISYLVDSNDDGITDAFYYHNNKEFWSGNTEIQSFPEESPVGDIFISEYDQFRETCLVELNMENLNQKTIRDSSGNLNPGIIIGDYSVKKDKLGEPATRDSFIQIPKIGTDKGAF